MLLKSTFRLGVCLPNHYISSTGESWKRTIPGLIFGLIVVLTLGVELICGAIFALVSGLIGALTDWVKVGKAPPNQGIKLSLKILWWYSSLPR
jgi:hypothetical protein